MGTARYGAARQGTAGGRIRSAVYRPDVSRSVVSTGAPNRLGAAHHHANKYGNNIRVPADGAKQVLLMVSRISNIIRSRSTYNRRFINHIICDAFSAHLNVLSLAPKSISLLV